MVKGIALAALLALSACQSPSGSFCALNSPMRPSEAEIAAMGDVLVAQMLAINLKGEKLCGWRVSK